MWGHCGIKFRRDRDSYSWKTYSNLFLLLPFPPHGKENERNGWIGILKSLRWVLMHNIQPCFYYCLFGSAVLTYAPWNDRGLQLQMYLECVWYFDFLDQKYNFKLNRLKCIIWKCVFKELLFENVEKFAFSNYMQ